MVTIQRTALAAALLAGSYSFSFAISCATMTTPAAAKPGAPPFCVKYGGPRGPDGGPTICRYVNYQACLQVAADTRGNCVVNIEFDGMVAPGGAITYPPSTHRSRRAN